MKIKHWIMTKLLGTKPIAYCKVVELKPEDIMLFQGNDSEVATEYLFRKYGRPSYREFLVNDAMFWISASPVTYTVSYYRGKCCVMWKQYFYKRSKNNG